MKKRPSGSPGPLPKLFHLLTPAGGGGERGPDGLVCFVGSSPDLLWVVLVALGDRPNLNESQSSLQGSCSQ